MKFGVTEDVKSSVKAPFEVSRQHPFNTAYLIDVVSEEVEFKKGDKANTKQPVLKFTFASPDKTKQHVETYFEVDETDTKYNDKVDWFNQKMKHLYETFVPFKAFGGGNSWAEYFTSIADAFNGTVREDGKEPVHKPIYKNKLVWLYLTYNNRGRLQIGFPNFVEAATDKNKEKPNTLFIKDKDVIDKPIANVSTPKGGHTDGAANDDIPEGWG